MGCGHSPGQWPAQSAICCCTSLFFSIAASACCRISAGAFLKAPCPRGGSSAAHRRREQRAGLLASVASARKIVARQVGKAEFFRGEFPGQGSSSMVAATARPGATSSAGAGFFELAAGCWRP